MREYAPSAVVCVSVSVRVTAANVSADNTHVMRVSALPTACVSCVDVSRRCLSDLSKLACMTDKNNLQSGVAHLQDDISKCCPGPGDRKLITYLLCLR